MLQIRFRNFIWEIWTRIKTIASVWRDRSMSISSRFETLWNHRITQWTLFAIGAFLCLRGLYHTPPIGFAIGALAAFAALMAAIMESLKAFAKFSWIVLLFGFLWVEMRAINED